MAGGSAGNANSGDRSNVRVVFVGDPGTGKSSLIVTAAAKTFPKKVPPLLPPTRLPADLCLDRIPVTIIDTSSSRLALRVNLLFILQLLHISGTVVYVPRRPRSASRARVPAHVGSSLPLPPSTLTSADPSLPLSDSDLDLPIAVRKGKFAEELRRADAVVLTYAYDQPSTLDRLSTFWLPELCRLEVKVPLIVVGCKLDLRDKQQSVSLKQMVTPIMQQFREIETCIECSAMNQIQVREVFCYAQKAVLQPTGPLFDKETQALKPRCVRALKRIFILCDHDGDGALSDAELNNFQTQETHQAKMLTKSPDLPQKALQIKQDDKFFSRLISKESTKANSSFRVYYGDASGAVPFMWESQPGKKTLVLREIPEDGVRNLQSNKVSLAACDIAVFVHDSSDETSWKRAKDLLVEVASHGEDSGFEVPCLIVAAKDDLDLYPMAIQDSTRVSQDMGIDAPIPVSTSLGDCNNVFHRILSAAEHPHLSIPETEAGRNRKQYHQLVNRSLMFVSVGAAVAIVGLAAYRVYIARKNASS
ncbi:hypothetical protein HHK36_022777 [Tetracentron sinense]|uniref:Miro domain-containing protein n=1 Tax=Tetracentron sinense TaxID=13715 RepID=A0A834YQL1_TETSI|nr:hypothetical protein HHK36_022777 [Tetracentron sinense]